MLDPNRQLIEDLRSDEESKKGLKALNDVMKMRDDQKSFDRCHVGSCNNKSVIEAHSIPVTALQLMADQSNMIIASSFPPPPNIAAFPNSDPLTKRSIHKFSAGPWACHEHDALFEPIDSKNIDIENERNLFLVVYRVTLRIIQATFRAYERVVEPILGSDVQQELPRLPDWFLEHSQQTVRSAVLPIMDLFSLQVQLDRILGTESYDTLVYRTVLLKTKPMVASSGIRFFDNLRNENVWGHEYIQPSMIPGWMVVLPQEHGQTIITASPIRGDRYVRDVHKGMYTRHGGVTTKPPNWTRHASKKMLSMSTDLAVSTEKYDSLTDDEQHRLQDYLRTRVSQPGKEWKLPNLLS